MQEKKKNVKQQRDEKKQRVHDPLGRVQKEQRLGREEPEEDQGESFHIKKPRKEQGDKDGKNPCWECVSQLEVVPLKGSER